MENATKRSAHLVDPELRALTDSLPPQPRLTNESLAIVRDQLRSNIFPVPEGLPVEISETLIPGPLGSPDVRVIIYSPKNALSPRPGYLYMHGGGLVYGMPDLLNLENASLALELGCTVVSVDYRLAPESPYPGAIEDCYAALKWMYTNAASLGVDKTRIAVGGESAGGGLAAALALLARDRAEVKILFQRLDRPMLDDRTCVAEPHPFNGEYIWTADDNRFGWRAYLGHEPGVSGVSPYASAARAEDLAGLPPTFIAVGAIDLFLDECLSYAQRLIRAGVPTELHVYPGAHHLAPVVPEARVAGAHGHAMLEALRRAFFG